MYMSCTCMCVHNYMYYVPLCICIQSQLHAPRHPLSGMFPIFYHPPPLCTTTATNPSSPRYHHRHLHTLIRLLTVPPPPPPPFYHYSQLHSRTIPCLARALFPTILSLFLSFFRAPTCHLCLFCSSYMYFERFRTFGQVVVQLISH